MHRTDLLQLRSFTVDSKEIQSYTHRTVGSPEFPRTKQFQPMLPAVSCLIQILETRGVWK